MTSLKEKTNRSLKSVSFSANRPNDPDERGNEACHEKLDPVTIRLKLSGLTKKSLQPGITNQSRNKTIEKAYS